jgi:hypothetical protein
MEEAAKIENRRVSSSEETEKGERREGLSLFNYTCGYLVKGRGHGRLHIIHCTAGVVGEWVCA